MAVDFAANTPRELPVKGCVKSNERFHRLAWGGLSSTPSMPYGILAGGMVDGGIGLWNPAAIMKYNLCFVEIVDSKFFSWLLLFFWLFLCFRLSSKHTA